MGLETVTGSPCREMLEFDDCWRRLSKPQWQMKAPPPPTPWRLHYTRLALPAKLHYQDNAWLASKFKVKCKSQKQQSTINFLQIYVRGKLRHIPPREVNLIIRYFKLVYASDFGSFSALQFIPNLSEQSKDAKICYFRGTVFWIYFAVHIELLCYFSTIIRE
jgi:hypothetical protein